MQNRAVIQSAQEAERLRRERPEATRLLPQRPIVDEMVSQLVADQFRELEEEVRQLRADNATEPLLAGQGVADDSRPAG